MDNLIKAGKTQVITAGATLTAGVPVVAGTLLAIPLTDIANGADGVAQIEGEVAHRLPKLSSAVVGFGTRLIWDVSAGEFIVSGAANGDLNNCAYAVEAAGNGVTSVKVKLCPGVGTVQSG